MPNEPEKIQMPQNKPMGTTTQIHTAQLPIDLQSKVIVKPANDNTKMIQQPTFRTIQQAPQMRVVRMPTPTGAGTQIIQTQMMPQILAKTGVMQPAGRSTITVSKSPAATYLPRVTATLSTIQQTKGGQQIRTPTPPVSGTAISPAFVRTSITPRTSSPTAVLSQGTTAWVSGTGAMQVQVPTQLIRSTITAQNRTHILQPNTVTVTNNSGNAQIANIFGQQSQQQNLSGTTTTISVPATTSGGQQNQQPTYVATVLPQRPQATIVYTSQQQQPFIQGELLFSTSFPINLNSFSRSSSTNGHHKRGSQHPSSASTSANSDRNKSQHIFDKYSPECAWSHANNRFNDSKSSER